MKKYKVIFNSSMDINSFQKKYFNNAFNSNVYLLEKNASNNFLSFISEKPISLIDMVSDADVCEISSENYNYNIDFPWCKNEKLFLNFYSKIFEAIAQFIQESEYWNRKTTEQDYLICQILDTVASVHKDGITHGYLSFYSNYLYYLSQIKSIASNETFLKIQNKITHVDNLDKIFSSTKEVILATEYDVKNNFNVNDLSDEELEDKVNEITDYFLPSVAEQVFKDLKEEIENFIKYDEDSIQNIKKVDIETLKIDTENNIKEKEDKLKVISKEEKDFDKEF